MKDKPRVLIVDDDEGTRRTLALIFGKKGYQAETVGTGQEALEKVQKRFFDVALLDLRLPDVEGVELLAPLKDVRPEMAMIIITGHASVQTAVQALDEGASGYITKPLNVDEMLAEIRKALEKQHLLQEKRRAEKALQASEERYRNLFERMPVGLYRTTPRGRILHANQALVEMLGYPDRPTLMQVNVGDLYVDPEERERERALLEREGVVRGFEMRLRRRDGSVVWVRDTVRVAHSVSRSVVYYEGSLQDITERKRAEEALQRYVERLRTMRAIDGAILGAWSSEKIAASALRHVGRVVPTLGGGVALFDDEAQEAILLASRFDGDVQLEAGTRFPLGYALDMEALQQGKIHVVEDVAVSSHAPSVMQTLQAANVRSYIALPLIAQGELIGVLALGAGEPDAFTPEHVDIAREVADQLAVGIQQARLRERVQRHAEDLEQRVAERTEELERRSVQLQVAAEVAREATTAHDLDALLNRAVRLIRERFGFYHAGIFLLDEHGEDAVLRAATGEAGRRMLEQGHRLGVGQEGVVGHVTGLGEPRVAHDVGDEAVHFKNSLLPDTRSEMALPLVVDGRVIGALDVQSREEAAFDGEDVAILQVLADQLAVIIEKARLFEGAQAALEERLRTVVSNAPVFLFALDRDGTFTLSEGRGLEALEIEPDDLLGQSAFDVYAERPRIQEDLRRALAGEAFAATRKLDGLVFEIWYSPLRDHVNAISGVIGVATNVTERKEMEEQLHRHERLAAVGQLAGGIAHDFNNFLTTIILYGHLIKDNPGLPPDLRPDVETLVKEAKRASGLVDQILDFSRRSTMEIQAVDLVAFVEEVTDILRQTIPENIQVVLEMEPQACVVEADPTRIQQALMNLALNARDAMSEGGELRIGLSTMTVEPGEEPPVVEMPPGEWVSLVVSDTGVGMTEEVKDHIFEPFFTTKERGEGTGLGLAQAYGIVKQHEGYIDVETAVGQGTTFRVYLPTFERKGPELGEEDEPVALPRGEGEAVLWVEDQKEVREVGRQVLSSLGYRVLTAASGEEALEIAQAVQVDLVITDLVMPGMGGKALIRELMEMTPDLKALVVTGYGQEKDLQQLEEEEGFLGVICKPFDTSTLAQAVRRAMDES